MTPSKSRNLEEELAELRAQVARQRRTIQTLVNTLLEVQEESRFYLKHLSRVLAPVLREIRQRRKIRQL